MVPEEDDFIISSGGRGRLRHAAHPEYAGGKIGATSKMAVGMPVVTASRQEQHIQCMLKHMSATTKLNIAAGTLVAAGVAGRDNNTAAAIHAAVSAWTLRIVSVFSYAKTVATVIQSIQLCSVKM